MKLFFTALLVLASTGLYAQSTQKPLHRPQAFYFNAGGASPIIALHYDRRFNKTHHGPGIGIGFGMIGGSGSWRFNVPVTVNYLLGKKTHFAELAAGTAWMNNRNDFNRFPKNEEGFIWHVNLGYRMQMSKGLLLRTGWSPLYTGEKFKPWFVYVGIGGAF
jgi:hypothetical protein